MGEISAQLIAAKLVSIYKYCTLWSTDGPYMCRVAVRYMHGVVGSSVIVRVTLSFIEGEFATVMAG